jgi:ATP-dependent Lon protease
VLPIGGLKEKLLAAHRGGIRIVIIPDENARDLKEIPDNIKRDLDIRPVKWMDDVMKIALERMPEPIAEAVAEPIVESATQSVSVPTPTVSISAH